MFSIVWNGHIKGGIVMRISLRGQSVTVLKSDSSDEVAVIITEVNKEDLFNAYCKLDSAEHMEVEGVDQLEFPEDFNIK